eukprot:g337.t1
MFRLNVPICKRGDDAFRVYRRTQSEISKSISIPQTRPLNMGRKRILTEDATRKVMGNDGKRKDPWDHLEFFDAEDVEIGTMTNITETAKPIDRPNVIQAPKAHEYYIKELDKIRKSRLKQMIQNGEATKEEVEVYEKQCWEDLNDPVELAEAEALISPPGKIPLAEFPHEGDDKLIDRSSMSFLDQLRFNFNVPSFIEFEEMSFQRGYQTPVVILTHPIGDRVVVSLHGGCILAWISKSGENRLFIHPYEQFDNRSSIMDSGISLSFPSYNAGLYPEDGFINRMPWTVVRSEIGVDWVPDQAPSITLRCRDSPESREIWPHEFEIFYKITLSEIDDFDPELARTAKEEKELEKLAREHGTINEAVRQYELKIIEADQEEAAPKPKRSFRSRKLQTEEVKIDESKKEASPSTQIRCQFTIRNTGDQSMEFMFAARNHLRIRSFQEYGNFSRILGLGARRYFDYMIVPGRPILREWSDDYVVLGDRPNGWNAIFTENKLNDVFISPGRQEYFECIYRHGMPDVLLQHKGIEDPQEFDIGNESLMLGRGSVSVPIKLAPGEEWEGEFVLRHHNEYWKEPIFGFQDGMPPPPEDEMEVIGSLTEGEMFETFE